MSILKYIQREYDEFGNFIRAVERDPVIDVSTPAEWPGKGMFINADMDLQILPAFREQRVTAEFIAKNELIEKGHFPASAFLATKPIHWTGDAEVGQSVTADRENIQTPNKANPATGGYVYQRPIRLFLPDNSGEYALGFKGTWVRSFDVAKSVANSPQPQILPEVDLEIDVSFDFRIKSGAGSRRGDMLVFFQVQVGAKYYNVEDSTWQNGPANNQIFVSLEDYDGWRNFKFIAAQPPFIGEFVIRFFQPVMYDPAAWPEYLGRHRPRGQTGVDGTLQIDNVSAKIMYRGAYPLTTESRFYVNNNDFTLVPDEIIIYHSDVTPYQNAELIFPYSWRVKKGGTIPPSGGGPLEKPKLTSLWRRMGYPESVKLIDLVLDSAVSASRAPTMRITGTINHTFLPIHYIRINYFDNRIFKVNGYRYNVRKRSIEVELLEVITGLPIEVEYMLLEDGGIILNELSENNDYLPTLLE